MSNEYSEPSCASCAYAQWDFDRDEHDFDIGCKYPFFGDIRAREDRGSILKYFHGDFVSNAKECGCYLSIEQLEIEDEETT